MNPEVFPKPKVKTCPNAEHAATRTQTDAPTRTQTRWVGTQPVRGVHADSVCCACPGRATPRTWRDPDA